MMTASDEDDQGVQTHPDIRSFAQVNQDLLQMLSRPGKGWWILFLLSVVGVVLFFAAWGHVVFRGIGVTGLMSPVGWGVLVTTFVFWVGIAHSGILISAILFLFRAPWRQSIYRAAEAMAVSAVMTAGLFSLIYLGRVWHAYWLIPYPNERFLWPNFRSPLLWDVFGLTAFITVSAAFFYLGTLPDAAAARDHVTGWRKRLYTILAMGWRGTDREWHHFGKAYLLLAALATLLVLTVHSVVSWRFAVSIVPGWHSTIFAPYFVAGATLSGLAMVITLTVPLRKIFKLEAYLTVRHFDVLAKLILLTSLVVLYSHLTELFMAWYSGEEVMRSSFWNRLFGPYWWATWTMMVCTGLVPIFLWLRRVRRSIPTLFVVSLLINMGVWFERFVIIVTSLSHEYMPFAWGLYRPSLTEMAVVVGSFGWFFFWFLLFTRILPPVAISRMRILGALGLLLVGPGCSPLDDAMVALFGRSMRDQASFRPYENPLPAPEESVPFAAGNLPAGVFEVNLGQPEGLEEVLPPFTPLDVMHEAPDVVHLTNPVFPEEASLQRGERIFLRFCAPCHGPSGDGVSGYIIPAGYPPFPLLSDRAEGFTDGYLYGIIRVGRGLMPAFGHQVSHFDRWHAVNFLRVMQGVSRVPVQGMGRDGPSEGAGDGAIPGEPDASSESSN